MISEIKRDGAAVTAGFAPRIFLDAQEIAGGVVIDDLIVLQIDFGGSIGDIETVALVGGDGGVFRSESSLAVGRVAGHGLVEEDVFVGGGLAVQSIISVGESGVFKSNAIIAFDDDTFGGGGGEGGVFYGDVGGGINGGGTFAGGFVGTLVDSDSATATIGTDSGAGSASGGDGEVFRIHDTAAGGHDTAGVVFGGFDGGVGNVDRGAIGIAIIGGGGTAVAKDAVSTGGVGGDLSVLNVQSGACTCQDSGIGTVEASTVAAITVTGFGDSDV